MRHVTLATVAALLTLIFLVTAPARATEPSASDEGCPSYRNELRVARTRLERGDRTGAIAALRHAKEALRACAHKDSSSERGPAGNTRTDPVA